MANDMAFAYPCTDWPAIEGNTLRVSLTDPTNRLDMTNSSIFLEWNEPPSLSIDQNATSSGDQMDRLPNQLDIALRHFNNSRRSSQSSADSAYGSEQESPRQRASSQGQTARKPALSGSRCAIRCQRERARVHSIATAVNHLQSVVWRESRPVKNCQKRRRLHILKRSSAYIELLTDVVQGRVSDELSSEVAQTVTVESAEQLVENRARAGRLRELLERYAEEKSR